MPITELDLAYLTPAEQQELDEHLTVLDDVPRSFRGYVDQAENDNRYARGLPGRYHWYRHCLVSAAVIDRIVDQGLRRVMVFEPPRHGKSKTFSQLLPGYYLKRFPDRWVGLTSYSATLARTHSRNARDTYFQVTESDSDIRAMTEWETGHGGGMWAAGVGGSITGKGFHLGIIDDPVKNQEEAESEVIRERNEGWYDSTFYTRQEPDAAIIVVLTRWPPYDLAQYILDKAGDDEACDQWHIVDFSAIRVADEEDNKSEFFPVGCTFEQDWREPGEALCPERYPEDALVRIQHSVTNYIWSALYQQRPRPREGGMFKREFFAVIEPTEVPALQHVTMVRWWDMASSPDDGDWTVGCKMGRHIHPKTQQVEYIVYHVKRGQWASGARDNEVRKMTEHDGVTVRIGTEQEPGSAGKDMVRHMQKLLEGYSVTIKPNSGDKVLRAEPLAAWAENVGIKLVRGPWNQAFIEELCGFPKMNHDDQVDAASGAFNALAVKPTLVVSPVTIVSPSIVANA